MNTNFSYDKMDYYSILEYLKKQAEYFSDGDWTDFSDADIGTVLLKLMAMNADTTNYQIEKGVSELYLDTAIERVNAIALCKLIGYEPRHYQSAEVDITAVYVGETTEGLKVPAYTSFSDSTGNVRFYTLEDTPIYTGLNTIKAYQGELVTKTYEYTSIEENGRLLLDDYNIGTNTVILSQGGLRFNRVENALYGEGEACFSVHINLDNTLYIQLPTYYATIMSNTTPIEVTYLLSSGIEGRVGSGVITGTLTLSNGLNLTFSNQNASEGGYNPETVEEIRKEAPAYASTMNTLVTLNDFRILSRDFPGVADAVALDYNYPESGLIQPTDDTVNDAYKVNLYILPESADSIYKEEEEDDTSTMTLLTSADITIDSTAAEYGFVFNEDHLENTNARINGSSCVSNIKFNNDWKKIVVKYVTETEEHYDYLYIDYNGENKASVSGEYTGQFTITNITSYESLDISYIKDGNAYFNSDSTKIYLYGTNEEEPTPTYTSTLLNEIALYVVDVKKKKPAGIKVNFMDVNYIKPQLTIKVYMDEDDLRYTTASTTIADYLEKLYSRENHKIGEPIYQSHLSKDIISKFDYVKYLEIINLEGAVDGAIKPNNTQYVELLADNITIKVVPYES